MTPGELVSYQSVGGGGVEKKMTNKGFSQEFYEQTEDDGFKRPLV